MTDDHPHDETCGHNHIHLNVADATGSRLLLTIGLNLLIPTAQLVGGLYANSMALISDAMHNFSDCTALLISYFAHRLGQREVSATNTFGYKRAEILAAQVNAVLLSLVVGFILYEAVGRLLHPQAVTANIVIWLAGVGIIGNGFSALLLHRDAKENLNIHGAFLHMLGDLLTSVAVLVAGVALLFKPWYWLDPLLSVLIVLFILKSCWSLLQESGRILMNATPRGLELEKVRASMVSLAAVCGVHYLHVWNISSSSIGFSCHVVVPDQPLSQTEALGQEIRHALLEHFGIDHAVLQFETTDCGNGGMLCEGGCTK